MAVYGIFRQSALFTAINPVNKFNGFTSLESFRWLLNPDRPIITLSMMDAQFFYPLKLWNLVIGQSPHESNNPAGLPFSIKRITGSMSETEVEGIEG
jgi:hypothetical protein